MNVFDAIDPCRQAVLDLLGGGETVGLVPTMGALHAGHLALIEKAKETCTRAAVTIFVNPTQFNEKEDYAQYPRDLNADLEACRNAGVDLVFTPSAETMYPSGSTTTVHVAQLSAGLCGPFRPGHFDGVATVVTKLFQILPADVAVFGEKDYQQLIIIRRLVRDLNIPIRIVGHPIVREPDGLAMSSRNVHLSPHERTQAVSLNRALADAVSQIQNGQRNSATIVEQIRSTLANAGTRNIDYIDIVDSESL
ncbi:MAG: pantoate--beta-alanine ligase, partial [Planctomycetota bacterium]